MAKLSQHDEQVLEMFQNADNQHDLYLKMKKLVHDNFNRNIDAILQTIQTKKILIITTQPDHAYEDKVLKIDETSLQYKYKGQMKEKKYDKMMLDQNCIKYFFRKTKLVRGSKDKYTYECLGKVTKVILETPRSNGINPCFLLTVLTSEIPLLRSSSVKEISLVSDYHIKLDSLLKYGIYPMNNNFSRGISEGYITS
jgi:hypothetical protein